MEAARLGVVDGLPEAARAEVGVLEEVLRGLQGAAGKVQFLGEGDDLALGAFPEPGSVGRFDLLGEGGGHQGHGRGDVGVLKKVLALDQAEERGEPGARTHDVHVAIGAGTHPGGDAQGGRGSRPTHARVGGGEEGGAAAVAGAGLALDDGDVDPVALASCLDAQTHERGGKGGDDAGVVAGEVPGVLQRSEAGVTGHVHRSAEALEGDFGGAVAAVGPGLAEGRDREEDEVVAGGGESVPTPPPRGGIAGREVLNHDVGLGGEGADLCGIGRVGDVEDA